ncbi:putative coiled-coil domain-containing protein 76, partial [Operophtera brumata]
MVGSIKSPEVSSNEPQCQHFVTRKKRLCRMTVRPGRQYCGEHDPQPRTEDGKTDERIPCPNDPKHTCYISRLERHLAVCNARQAELPAYMVPNINAPAPAALETFPERPIHPAVLEEFSESDRAESSLRHLRQASRLLWLAEDEGLVDERTCYAWCAGASRVLLVDRASLRHKRDNRLRGRSVRLRADLAHLALERVPVVAESRAVVGLAKHLCGVATAQGVTDPEKRKAVFFASCGSDLYNLVKSLVFPKTVSEATLVEIETKLDNHFSPRPNEIVESFKFHTRKQ